MTDTTNNSEFAHIEPSLIYQLELPAEQRTFEFKRGSWIDYPHANAFLKDVDGIMTGPTIDRMPCRLLTADSDNGKTQVLKAILRAYPSSPNPHKEAAHLPVVLIEAVNANEKEFLQILMRAFFEEIDHTWGAARLAHELDSVLAKTGTRMLLIDEFHQLFSGTGRQQREVLNRLKNISNRHRISIVSAGVAEAATGVQIDEQWANRFQPAPLPRWEVGQTARQLLMSLERRMPLRHASNLAAMDTTTYIVQRCEGLIGYMVSLVTLAAELAVNSKSERITMKELKGCAFVDPKERRKLAQALRRT